MADRPAVNASPLIFLARANLLDLLQLAGPDIVREGPEDPAAGALRATPWMKIVEAPPVPPVIQAWDLGAGESSVLAWALGHPGTVAILDDLAARRCAAAVHVPVRGTLGLILLAKERGRIDAARPVLEAMRATGMYLSDAVLDRALSLVGE